MSPKVAVVTGSTGGIGEATAKWFSEQGYAVVVNSSRSVVAGEALAKALPNSIYIQGAIGGDFDADGCVSQILEH